MIRQISTLSLSLLVCVSTSNLLAETCAYSKSSSSYTKSDVVDTAIKAGSFKTLVKVVQAADLVHALKAPGPITVFAPTDEAFSRLPSETIHSLLQPENRDQLKKILTFHVLPGKIRSSDLVSTGSAVTLNGKNLQLSLIVNEARITKADIECSNGIIHVIDRVMLPSENNTVSYPKTNILGVAKAAGQFSTLLAAVQAAGLEGALNGEGPFTVFAPTDKAFAALPKSTLEHLLTPEGKSQLQKILTYHVAAGEITRENANRMQAAGTLSGSDLHFSSQGDHFMVEKAKILKENIYCHNGIIHVIDAVMLPPENNDSRYQSIVGTAQTAGSFDTLVTAVQTAGLVEALSGKGPFTVFAPTDEAFDKLPKSTVKHLLSPAGRSDLQAILKYHVVPGQVLSGDLLKVRSAQSLQGQPLHFNLMVNDANVIRKDIKCTNGVIHVIDKVVLPPTKEVAMTR